jgi:hypothetical protein
MPTIRFVSRASVTLAAITVTCFAAGAIAGSHFHSHVHSTQSHSTVISDEPSVMPGKRLDIDLITGGGLSIAGGDANEVSVSYSNDDGQCPDAEVNTEKVSTGVRVTSRFNHEGGSHNCSMNLIIKVPKRYDLHIHSAGGSIAISNVEGTISGMTGGGELELQHLRGTIELKTGGGQIHVANSRLEGSVSTGGGHVVLENVSDGLRASSGSEPVVRRGRSKSL